MFYLPFLLLLPLLLPILRSEWRAIKEATRGSIILQVCFVLFDAVAAALAALVVFSCSIALHTLTTWLF